GPVGLQGVERRTQGTNAALEMGVEVLLVAALVGLGYHLLLGQLAVVGHVEEVAGGVAQALLATLLQDGLLEHDDAVALLGTRGLVLELGQRLGLEDQVEELALDDDALLDARLLGSRLAL